MRSVAVAQPLPTLAPGTPALVTGIDADGDDIGRLMAMGVCVGRQIELVKPGDPLILRVFGTRIGVSARLAERVFVAPTPAPATTATATAPAAT